MDVALIPAIAALAGSAIGALASLASTWLTQHAQVRAQRVAQAMARRSIYLASSSKKQRMYTQMPLPTRSTIPQNLSAFTLLSENCNSSPLPRSSRRQRTSCYASSNCITTPIQICIILKSGGTSRKWMCCAHSAKPAAMTCAFRSGPRRPFAANPVRIRRRCT